MITSVKDAGIVSDVNLRYLTGNPYGVNSITLTLVSPKGTRVRLFDRKCSVTGEFNCSFDDDGSYKLVNPSNGCPPTNGKIIRPEESLSKFNGEDKKGDWILEITADQFLTGRGDFSSYTIDICSELIVNNPVLINNQILQLLPNQTKGIGQDLLLSQDIDNTPAELVYTIVVIPQRGDLLINGVVAVYGSKFTQKDIDDGKLSYHHKGQDNEMDGFLFLVEDGTGGWFGTDFFKIQIGTVATKDLEDVLTLNIYPNPANNMLQISSDKMFDRNATLDILNIQGQLVFTKNIGAVKADILNVSQLTDGIYLLHIRSGKFSSVSKVIIRK
jgi:hypothetical protein